MIPLLAILFFITAYLAGISLVLSLLIFREKILTIASGILVGVVLLTSFTYLSTSLFILSPLLILCITLLAAAYIVFAYIKQKTWIKFKSLDIHNAGLIVLIVLMTLSALITPKILFLDSDTGALETSTINAYGDLGFHLANITNLAYSSTIPPNSPISAGNRLTYPFFSNFFSAILLIAGASFSQSVVWPALIFIPTTLILFYYLVFSLTNNSKAALIALPLFALSGGTFGWVRILDYLNVPHESFIQTIANFPLNFTGHSDDPLSFFLVNPIVSLLIPQRSFMFGMSIAFVLILLLALSNSHPKRKHILILAGLLAGLLPLWHAHTVIALIPAIIGLFILKPNKNWLHFFITAFLVGLPGILYFLTSEASSSAFPHIQLGWMAHDENIFIFWLKNTGLLIPVTIYSLLIPGPKHLKAIASAGLVLFIASNIWLFAAWEWDNTKILVYWVLFSLPLVSYTAIKLWVKGNYIIKGLVVSLVLFHLLSGSIDVFRLALPQISSWEEWSADNIAMANYIQTHTERSDTIIMAPYHNSPTALSGRSAYLGFPGHVWTHGGSHFEREEAIEKFYNGEIKELPLHQPQYVIVGPVERSNYPNLQIQPEWDPVTTMGKYELYRL